MELQSQLVITPEQESMLQDLFKIVPTPTMNLAACTRNAVDALTEAGKAELDGETVGGCFQVLPWLTLVRETFEILQNTVLSSRNLTVEELSALEALDQIIGRLANKTSRIVKALKEFEKIGNGGQRLY
jgi:hypothetical protein